MSDAMYVHQVANGEVPEDGVPAEDMLRALAKRAEWRDEVEAFLDLNEPSVRAARSAGADE